MKKRTGLARTYTTPLPCFQRKLKKVQQDIIKQPANCINKTKRDTKKKINDLDTEYPDIFIGDSCQKLLIVKDVLVYFGKYVNAFVFNGSLLEDRSRYGYNVNIIYATNSLLISVANQSVTEEVKRGKTLFLKIKWEGGKIGKVTKCMILKIIAWCCLKKGNTEMILDQHMKIFFV